MDINVTTYLNQLGYGLTGLNVIKALVGAGHTPTLWINGPGQCPEADRAVVEAAVARSLCYNQDAPSLRIAHQWDMAHRVGRGTHAGMTFFELDLLNPQERFSLSNLDVVMVPSEWACRVLEDNGVPMEKVVKAPLGVDTSIFHPDVSPAFPDPGWAKAIFRNQPTVFLSCGKWEIRKGHDVLCEAFNAAFTPRDNVLLILNCDNPFLTDKQSKEWTDLYDNSPMGRYASRAEHIVVWPRRLGTQREVASLMAYADCGVFLARAEGWNMELLEMMAMGKHVIATNYSAHTEFANHANCMLVEPEGVETAYDGVFFKGGGGRWAELGQFSVEAAVEFMRDVHRKKQSGQLRVNDAGVDTARRFSWENTANYIVRGLS